MPRPLPPGWFPQRGEIYYVFIDKIRPAIILSVDALNRSSLDVCVVPLTTSERRTSLFRLELPPGTGGLRRQSFAKCDQVMTVAKSHFKLPPLGQVDDATLDRIALHVKIVLGIPD